MLMHVIYKESLRRVFSSCGKVLKVFLHEKPTKGEPPQEKSKFFPVHRPPQVQARIFYIDIL